MSCGGTEETLPRISLARIDLDGFRRLIARRGPGLTNLGRLPVGRHVLPEHPIHITLGGDDSPCETPKAI